MLKKDKKYEEFAQELYEHGALDKDNFDIITKSNKISNSKNYTIEKDDIEH